VLFYLNSSVTSTNAAIENLTNIAMVTGVKPYRVVITTAPAPNQMTLVAVLILPPPTDVTTDAVASQNASAKLLSFMNSNGNKSAYGNALSAVQGPAIPGDQTLLVNCNGVWKTKCSTDYSEGLTLWMQGLLVCAPIVIVLICIYACCCGPNSDLWFTHDKDRRPNMGKRKSKKASTLMEMAPLDAIHITSSKYSLHSDQPYSPAFDETDSHSGAGANSPIDEKQAEYQYASNPFPSSGSRPNLVPKWTSKPPS